MPKELVQLARVNNCEQPRDFYSNKPGPVNPPYLYGVAKGNIEDSAVFWCIRDNDNDKKYVLMFMVKERGEPRSAGELEWVNPPMGLSLYQPNDLQIQESVFELIRKEDAIHMPKDKRFEDRYIMSSYDGISEIFVMKNGRWMILQRH